MIRHDRTWNGPDTIKKIHRHARSPRENPQFQESTRFNREPMKLANGDPVHPVLDALRGKNSKLYAYELSRLYEQDMQVGGRGFGESYARYSNDPDEVLSTVYGPGGASTAGFLADLGSPTLARMKRQGRTHLLRTFIPKTSRTARNPQGRVSSV